MDPGGVRPSQSQTSQTSVSSKPSLLNTVPRPPEETRPPPPKPSIRQSVARPAGGAGGSPPPSASEDGDELEPKRTRSRRRTSFWATAKLGRDSLTDKPIKTRKVILNGRQEEKFCTNVVRTSKYSFLSFIPYFLYEQFRKVSNIFFLGIAICQQFDGISPTGRYTTAVPLTIIICVSAIKEIVEDIKRHKADAKTNRELVQVFQNGSFQYVKWKEVAVGDFVKVENEKFIPADLVLLSSSEPLGMAYIETANLDGETNFKLRQASQDTAEVVTDMQIQGLKGFLECGVPNKQLYEFLGSLHLDNHEDFVPLGPDQVLLRGAKLRNTKWVIGLCIYSGKETKLMMNSTKAPLKRSTMEIATNVQIAILFGCLILISLISTIFFKKIFSRPDELEYLGEDSNDFGGKQFLTFIILYNNLIPISLSVTLECVRFVQALFINWDLDMYHEPTMTPALARTSNLNEELGQVRYVLSDKTGTLTRNIMEFKGCSISGVLYDAEFMNEVPNPLLQNMERKHKTAAEIHQFLILLAVCHTIIPEETENGLMYHASSPDEKALTDAARTMGCVFESRTPTEVDIDNFGSKERYELLNIIEFTSSRKRMSVIVRCPDHKIRLFCKGADSVIYERLGSSNSEEIKIATKDHLQYFAKTGLRTLCIASTDLSEKDYEHWRKIYLEASNDIVEREKLQEEASNLIERNLHLIGATAIEDKLQDDVPETIHSLLMAGISVWVLTGDKQETAMNIGYSSRLLAENMELYIINEVHRSDTAESIDKYSKAIMGGRDKAPTDLNAAIIIDGKSLTYALEQPLRKTFIDLCCCCRSVIVCRASPLQKAEIVQYVREYTGKVTLAIGDGANDCAMIQKAHVGVGISGQEGLQAVNTSDYAIAQFSYLAKLLFVHGAWNYDRMAKVILYSYYKNICLYLIQLWFATQSAWSGQVIFERWTIGFYNVFFTSWQPLAFGIFERNGSMFLRKRFPYLYKYNTDFGLKTFIAWLADAIYQSAILFFLPLLIFGDGVIWSNGKEGSFLVLGNIIYTYVVITVSLKCGLEMKSWTIFTHIAIWGSILMWIVFLCVYSYFWPTIPIAAELVGVGPMVFTSWVFWFGLPVVFVALLPALVAKVIKHTFFGSGGEQLRTSDFTDTTAYPSAHT